MDALREDEAYRKALLIRKIKVMTIKWKHHLTCLVVVYNHNNNNSTSTTNAFDFKPPQSSLVTKAEGVDNVKSAVPSDLFDIPKEDVNNDEDTFDVVNDFSISKRTYGTTRNTGNMESSSNSFGFGNNNNKNNNNNNNSKQDASDTAPPLKRRDTMDVLRSNEAHRIVERELKESGKEQLQEAEIEGLRLELEQVELRAVHAEEELKTLQAEMEQKIGTSSKATEEKYLQLKQEYDNLQNTYKLQLKEINEKNEKQIQDALSVERINQGKILMQKEMDFNELLQNQLNEQGKMHEQRMKDNQDKYEKQMSLLKQETDHKLEIYRLEMEQLVENEKSKQNQNDAKSISEREERVRSTVREEMAKEYNQQRDELVKMMKSQAEEYRAKLKKRHADQIVELENEIVKLKTEVEHNSSTLLSQKSELENSFQLQSEEKNKLKEEIALLRNELAERENTEAIYREEFEKELEKEMLALTATAIQKEEDKSHYRPTNSPSDRVC